MLSAHGVSLIDVRWVRVIRASGPKEMRPVVVPLNEDSTETDEELDLTSTDSVRVVQALLKSDVRGSSDDSPTEKVA